MAKPITAEEVVASADTIARRAMNQLSSEIVTLHDRGYGQWSGAMSDMKFKIETALSELVDEVMPS